MIYLFLAVLDLHCSTGAFSSCREWGLLFAVVWSPGSRLRGQLWRVGSVVAAPGCTGLTVVVPGLSCFVACGIFPDQGLNPCLLHWQADSLPLSHEGSP